MKTTLFMAMSANGIIATETGAEEFLSDENWEKFCQLAKEFGNFIYGRKTYQAVKKWGGENIFSDLKNIQKIVISRDSDFQLDDGFILANSPEEALEKLSQKGFEKALIAGGATTNAAFVKAGLLDEIVLNIEPVFVGKGIPLFAAENFELKTKLISMDKSTSGIVTLRYSVLK